MFRISNFVLRCMMIITFTAVCCSAGAQTLNIGSRLELFVDDYLIERMDNTSLKMHPPVRQEVVHTFDAPWEGPQSGYATIIKDGDRYLLYYRGGGDLTTVEVACVAESADGINFTRPKLGLWEFEGSKENNIVWIGDAPSYREAHNFTPFKDANPNASPDQRWKAVALSIHPDETGERRKMLFALVSPDGIRWKRLQDGPIISEGSFDSQNVAFWDTVQKQYVCYARGGYMGKRAIARSTSDDFIHWSKPVWLEYGDAPLEQFYTNAITPYFRAPHIYLGFPMRFVPERKTVYGKEVDALSDAVFMSSHDGQRWNRPFMEAFIRPGLDPINWGNGHGNTTPALGVVPTGDSEISVYWMEHYGLSEETSRDTPRIRRGTLRTDGFVSVNAPYSGGEFLTKPLRFRGRELAINYSTSAVGRVRVEIQDSQGKPIPGFALDDCSEIYGDEIERTVSWNDGLSLTRLAGRTIRLRFVMKDADLYSIRFK